MKAEDWYKWLADRKAQLFDLIITNKGALLIIETPESDGADRYAIDSLSPELHDAGNRIAWLTEDNIDEDWLAEREPQLLYHVKWTELDKLKVAKGAHSIEYIPMGKPVEIGEIPEKPKDYADEVRERLAKLGGLK